MPISVFTQNAMFYIKWAENNITIEMENSFNWLRSCRKNTIYGSTKQRETEVRKLIPQISFFNA